MVLKVSNISGTQESSASSSLADANSLDHLHSSATWAAFPPGSQVCVRTHSGTSDNWWNTDTKGPTTTLGLVPQLCSNSVSPTEAVGSSLWHGLALSGSSFSTGIPACPLHCPHIQFSGEWRDLTQVKVQLWNSSCCSAGSEYKFSTFSLQSQVKPVLEECTVSLCHLLKDSRQNTPSPEHMFTHRLSLAMDIGGRQPYPRHLLGIYANDCLVI